MHLRPALLLGLFFTATGCLVGRDLTLIEAEPQVSNIEAAPNEDGGTSSGDPTKPADNDGKPSSSSSSSSSGDPTKPKDGGADAEGGIPEQDAGPGNPIACPAFGRQEIEPNNTQVASMAILKGDTCGKLNVFGDEDWFTYDTGDAGGFLRLKFIGEGDARIVVNNGGITFSGGSGSSWNVFSQGRWYIRIFSPSRATPTYVITREL